jgi:hypothetical protein
MCRCLSSSRPCRGTFQGTPRSLTERSLLLPSLFPTGYGGPLVSRTLRSCQFSLDQLARASEEDLQVFQSLYEYSLLCRRQLFLRNPLQRLKDG